MKTSSFFLFALLLAASLFLATACEDDGDTFAPIDPSTTTVVDVDPALFTDANPNTTITTVACTLSDGTATQCYQITTSNAAFSNISHNQSALYVVKEGFSKKHFMLSDENAHTADLQVTGNEFVLAAASGGFTGFVPFLLFGAIALMAVAIHLRYSRKRSLLPKGYTPNQFT